MGLRKVLCLLAGAAPALTIIAPQATAQTIVGYDALGRVSCIRVPASPTPKYTAYTYDAAGNRTAKAVTASAAACTSQTAGAVPTQPVTLTATNPSSSVASASTTNYLMTTLGSASDAATLTLVSASAIGIGGASCGSATSTGTNLTFVAPTGPKTCYVDYVFSHPNGQREAGRIKVTVAM